MPIWRKEHEVARVSVHFIGLIVTAISGAAFCGQIAHSPIMYQWGFYGTMSLPTALCLILTGVALFLLSRGEGHYGGEQ